MDDRTPVDPPALVRVWRDGRFTIPVKFRRALGLDDDTILRVTLIDGGLRVAPEVAETRKANSAGLRDHSSPRREDIAATGMSAKEIAAEIDAANAEVRAERRAERSREDLT